MKRILFFAQEAGSANCVAPVFSNLNRLGYRRLDLYGKDLAMKVFKTEGLKALDIRKAVLDITEDSIRSFLEQNNYKLIITGCAGDDFTERILWKTGADIGIPSIAILDSWVNYKTRFLYPIKEHFIVPTKICVMDQYAKKELFAEGISKSIIKVTGQPYFETIEKRQGKIKERDISSFRKRLKLKKECRVALFASQPIVEVYNNSLGYNQFTILREVLCAFNEVVASNTDKWVLIIKPHPQDDVKKISSSVLKYLNSHERLKRFDVKVCRDVPAQLLILLSDFVIGMSSMFLIEAVLANKPVLRVQIGLLGEDPFVMNRRGMIKSIYSKSELYEALQKSIQGGSVSYAGKSFPVKKYAIKNITNVIKSLL